MNDKKDIDLNLISHSLLYSRIVNFCSFFFFFFNAGPNGETIACCRSGKTDPECFPVQLSPKDEYYSKYNITCMEFVRSAPALRCSFGKLF